MVFGVTVVAVVTSVAEVTDVAGIIVVMGFPSFDKTCLLLQTFVILVLFLLLLSNLRLPGFCCCWRHWKPKAVVFFLAVDSFPG